VYERQPSKRRVTPRAPVEAAQANRAASTPNPAHAFQLESLLQGPAGAQR